MNIVSICVICVLNIAKAFIDTLLFNNDDHFVLKTMLIVTDCGVLFFGLVIVFMLAGSLHNIHIASEKFEQKNPRIIHLTLLMTVLICLSFVGQYACQIYLATKFRR